MDADREVEASVAAGFEMLSGKSERGRGEKQQMTKRKGYGTLKYNS